MNMFRIGWSLVLITALAVAGYLFEWPKDYVIPALVVIMIIGLITATTGSRERELERASLRLKELAGYFNRRFAGNSSLSIFAIIDGLFNVDNPKLWDWARACDMSRRVFDSWCNSFIGRVETDLRSQRFTLYLHTYLNELWLITSHYHEFVEQFYEVAEKVTLSGEVVDQYGRFVMEYNAFVQQFRDHLVELRKVARTEIEPPSIKLARELPEAKPLKAPPEAAEEKPSPSVERKERKGYIM